MSVRVYDSKFKELKKMIAKIIIPDYSQNIVELSQKLSDISSELKTIPKQHKDYTTDLIGIAGKFDSLLNTLESKLSVNAKSEDVKRIAVSVSAVVDRIRAEIDKTQAKLENSITENTKMDKFVKELMAFDRLNKMLGSIDTQNKANDSLRLALGIK
jgi:hypothetical protein